MNRRDKGNLGETLAQNYLKKKGYRILETNYRCSLGEIDIIARQGECLVFVEVRSKSNLNWGSPEESITPKKIDHFEKAVAQYQQTHSNLPGSWRIDLVVIEMETNTKLKRIEIIENAFE